MTRKKPRAKIWNWCYSGEASIILANIRFGLKMIYSQFQVLKKYSDHSAMDCYDEDISEYLISDTVHVDYIYILLSISLLCVLHFSINLMRKEK